MKERRRNWAGQPGAAGASAECELNKCGVGRVREWQEGTADGVGGVGRGADNLFAHLQGRKRGPQLPLSGFPSCPHTSHAGEERPRRADSVAKKTARSLLMDGV